MEWLQEMTDAYRSGTHRAFILTGNIRDAGENNARFVLTRYGAFNFRMTLVFDIAAGLQLVPADNPPSSNGNVATYSGADARQKAQDQLVARFKERYLTVEDPIMGKRTIAPRDVTPADMFNLIDRLQSEQRESVGERYMFIFDHADAIFPRAPIAQLSDNDRKAVVTAQKWGRDERLLNSPDTIVLVAADRQQIHEDVVAADTHYRALRIPYPQLAQRLAFLNKLLSNPQAPVPVAEGVSAKDLAILSSGLNLQALQDLTKDARREKAPPMSARSVEVLKRQVMEQEFGSVLEPMNPKFGFQAIGGHELVINYLQKSCIRQMRLGNVDRVPMGMLMIGPPGTGKTALAEAFAYEIGVNAVRLNPAQIFGKYVGDSERNLERALEGIEAMTPTVVFIDELDQKFQRGESGDSGVSNRVFARLMEWASDTSHRGEVFLIAATNRPDLLDAALKREGRFDLKIPLFPPESNAERLAIFHAMGFKYKIDVDLPESLLSDTEGWTGAEIEGLTIKAKGIALDNERTSPVPADWQEAFDIYIPTTQDIQKMIGLALKELNDLSLVPDKYRDEVRRLNNREKKATTTQSMPVSSEITIPEVN